MYIEQIRNATIKITYGAQTFLVDPWLASQGAMGCLADYKMSIPDAAKEKLQMPLVALPHPVSQILAGVDAYIVTHIHPDHIDMSPDGTVGQALDKTLPVYVPSAENQKVFLQSGFTTVKIFTEQGLSLPGGVTLKRTPALHGTKKPCGPASGFILEQPQEKRLYVAGDTIWFAGVQDTLARLQPEVIVLNAGDARLEEFGRIIMDAGDVAKVYGVCPDAAIIASHLDTVAHGFLTRQSLRKQLSAWKLKEQILIPEDGEVLAF